MQSKDEWIKKTIESLFDLLPDESVMGEPFWTIMEKDSGYEQAVKVIILEWRVMLSHYFFLRKWQLKPLKG